MFRTSRLALLTGSEDIGTERNDLIVRNILKTAKPRETKKNV